MADSKVQRQAEAWIRDEWLPTRYGQPFTKGRLTLQPGGAFEFDGISRDGSVAVCIATNSGRTTGDKKASSKLHKLRADALFLIMADVTRRVIVLTDSFMFDICRAEKENGRLPRDIEIEFAELPADMRSALLASQIAASNEMASVKLVCEVLEKSGSVGA